MSGESRRGLNQRLRCRQYTDADHPRPDRGTSWERSERSLRMSLFRKSLALAALGAAVLASGPALADPPWARGWHHHHRHWGPPPPVVYAPPRVYYAPPPVYVAPPPPVVYAPPPPVYVPAPSLGLSFNIPLR